MDNLNCKIYYGDVTKKKSLSSVFENIDGKDFKQDYLNKNKIDSDTFDRYYQIFVKFMYYVVSKKIFLMIKKINLLKLYLL